MRALATCAIATFLFTLIAGCGSGSAELKEFAPDGGRCKVLMPGNPKLETTQAQGIMLRNYTAGQRNGAYVVSFADMPIPPKEPEAKIQVRLDGSVQGMIASGKLTLTNSSKITLDNKYPGREVNADLPNQKGIMRARIYLVDGRLYQVLVNGTKDWASSADATRFLDSFALTK